MTSVIDEVHGGRIRRQGLGRGRAGMHEGAYGKGMVMKPHWPVPGLHTASAELPVESGLPGFGGATGWLNSPPLTPAALQGKVVLAGFWTYTCINWLRQLPYLRAWADKYSGQGCWTAARSGTRARPTGST